MASIGIIGGADGPTAILLTGSLTRAILLPVVCCAALLALLYLALYRRGRAKALCCAVSVLAIVAADQYVKLATAAALRLNETADFLPPLLRLRRIHNYGAAWSSLSGARWLLIAATTVGMAALVWLLLRIVRHPLGVWALTMVVGGGVGNLIDRIARGFVVDMFETMFMRFPVFNVADCFVVIGTVLGAIYYLSYYDRCDAGNWRDRHGAASSDGT